MSIRTPCDSVKQDQSAAVPPAAMTCPDCGHRAKKVALLAVKSLVRYLPFEMSPSQYYFCEAPGCDVVYFPFEPSAHSFRQAALLVRVGAKEESEAGLVCYCFGVTRKAIREEIERTGKSTVGERIKAEVQACNCACEVKNPAGKCCLGNVGSAVKDCLKTGRTASRTR